MFGVVCGCLRPIQIFSLYPAFEFVILTLCLVVLSIVSRSFWKFCGGFTSFFVFFG